MMGQVGFMYAGTETGVADAASAGFWVPAAGFSPLGESWASAIAAPSEQSSASDMNDRRMINSCLPEARGRPAAAFVGYGISAMNPQAIGRTRRRNRRTRPVPLSIVAGLRAAALLPSAHAPVWQTPCRVDSARSGTATALHEPVENTMLRRTAFQRRTMAGRIPVESLDTLLTSRRTFLAFLQKRTGSREDAEEILQSAFARALEKGGGLRRDESVVAWFYRLLRNSLV